MRVLKMAENMAVIGGDIDIIRASVLFHDVITYSKNSPDAKTETQQAAAYTRDLLESIEFPERKINRVMDIIANTSFSKGQQSFGDEAYIMYNADKLDQSGAIAIMRYFASGGQMNREFYNPEDPFLKKKETKPEVFKYTIDALLDRLPKIAKSITMPSARDTAQQRNEFFNLFLRELELELNEAKNGLINEASDLPGAFQIMKVFGEAGKKAQMFYDPKDPFCKKREPQPSIYPLDALIASYTKTLQIKPINNNESVSIKRRIEFFDNYFNELSHELEGEIVPPPRLKITREIWAMVGPTGEIEE
jgi:uncharacterized protein